MEWKQPDLVLLVARSFATKLATPTLIADARGDLVYFNDAAAEVIGRSYLDVGKLPASRWQELFKPRTLDEQPLTAEETPSGIALLQRRPVHGSFAFRGLDGRDHEITVTAFPLLSHPDEVVGVMSIFWGPPPPTPTLREPVSRYLSPPLFPIGLSEAPAEVTFEDVPRKPWRVGSAVIEAQTVEHRGPTLGYRIEEEGRVLAYLPDHEPYLTAALDDEPQWISGWALAAGADLLLHDSQYTEEEYPHRLGWGHSSVKHAATFARAAGVRQLAMFHHDPMRSDRELEALYDQVAEIVQDDQEPPLIAREGLAVVLDSG